MFLKKEDLQVLLDIEVFLWNNGNTDLYFKLYNLNERLIQQRDKTNKKSYERIKEKRKIDKNYARKKESKENE